MERAEIVPHAYSGMSPDELEELLSNFLIDTWSYSKVSTFARNEKAFEMQYIYRNPFKVSASTVAGSAYHEALECYFDKSKGAGKDLAGAEIIAFNYIDDVEPVKWRVQKSTPSVEDCKTEANKIVTALLRNFFEEKSLYEDDIEEILGVELRLSEFIIVNRVDVPLPCNCVIDLVIRTKSGKVVIIDHKSKRSFSDEEEVKFIIGKQAMTYVHCYETHTGIKVDDVWFVENKYSKNRDGSPQLNRFEVELSEDTRRLYDALLYEPLRRMLEAISNPDYVYLINENDSFMAKSELFEFWAQTMIAEVEEFDIPESKKEMISRRLKKIRDTSVATVDPKTIRRFKEDASRFIQYDLSNKNMTKEEKIEHVLRKLGVTVEVAHKFDGYSSDTFLLDVSAGTQLSAVHRYKLDIARALDVSNIRMNNDLFVYENKSYIAIESAKTRDRDLIYDPKYLEGNKIPLGKDNFERVIYWDLDNHSTPHALICGATGSGKSVQIKSIIEYAKLAGVDRIVILDPKYEFFEYKNVEGVEVYEEILDIETKMKDLVEEMNSAAASGRKSRTLIIFDEFADAVANSRTGNALKEYDMVVTGNYKDGRPKTKRECINTLKSLEENLRVLLQKGRSLGYRIVAATQRASVKVITGDAKVNFPVLICFRVPKDVDSKVVLDESGAESLAGRGDGLIKSPEYFGVVRYQAFYKP